MKNQEELSWADIKAMFAETDKRFKKTEKMIKENAEASKKLDERLVQHIESMKADSREADKRLAQHIESMKADSREADKRLAQHIESMKTDSREADKRLDRLGVYLGGVSNSNGDMAEEYFYNTLNRDKKFANETFDKMKRNVCYDENDNEIECDILMINGKSTVLIEVKYNARVKNINIENLIKRANILKQIEMHKDHNIYLGVAAMSFNKKLAKELRQAGIATIHHTGKKMVLYDKEVKMF